MKQLLLTLFISAAFVVTPVYAEPGHPDSHGPYAGGPSEKHDERHHPPSEPPAPPETPPSPPPASPSGEPTTGTPPTPEPEAQSEASASQPSPTPVVLAPPVVEAVPSTVVPAVPVMFPPSQSEHPLLPPTQVTPPSLVELSPSPTPNNVETIYSPTPKPIASPPVWPEGTGIIRPNWKRYLGVSNCIRRS